MSETARTEESTLTNICGDPPKINVNLPERNELTQNFKLWKDVQLPIDILLLTVKDCEFLSCYYYIVDPFRSYCKGLGHVYFGSIGKDQDVKLKVALMRCSEGSKAPGGSLTVVKNAVTQLRPKAVFSVGHCSGTNQETTKLGDVVLSEKLTTYSHQKATKVGKKFFGVTTPVSRDIAELIKCAGYGWNAPLKNPKERKVEVHCGEVLSGPEIVQAEWRQNELVESFPEAIAIETEGEGVYSAAHDLKMEWVVVKGISGYADGTETEEKWKTCASVTAASLVFSILNDCSIFEDWPHYRDISTDRQHSAVSKEVPVEPSCSSAQSSHQQHASSAITTGRKRRSSSESLVQGIKRSKLEDSSAMKFLEWCQNQLRAFYKTMCQVKITPWDPDNTVHINDIYIQVTLLQDHRKPDGATKNRVGDISEVFEGDEHHPIRRRIVVYGRPGIGKSTFTQKLAVDWAGGKKEILRKFSLLLVIKLRDVCDIPDLCAMLKTAELLSADDPMAVNNLYEYVRQNQEKVLLILDGYDEYSGGKSSPVYQIWSGGQLRDCCVMITTRPVKEDELRMPSHAQFELNGFDSREQKKQFARKILADEEDVEGLLDYLKKQDLEEMAEIPLLLLMLCLLWKEKKNQLPLSRAPIYEQFIQTLLDHMATKDAENVATCKSIHEYREELSKIGKLAYDALLEDHLYFNLRKFPSGDLFEKVINVGFLQVSRLSALNRKKVVYFLHKSVQEFLAAVFIVEEVTAKKNETVTCLSGMDSFEKSQKMAEVLKFVCELSSEAACFVFHHLLCVGEKECLTNYNFTKTPTVDDFSNEQKDFILLCVDCFFSCPSSDRPAVYSAFLSCVKHVVILREKHASTATVEHLLKSTGGLTIAQLKETEVRFRDESDGDNDDDDDDESTLGKKEEELLGAKEKTMEEVSEEKESLETKGSMTEVKIIQDAEASSTMEIPEAESSTRMKSLLYAESEECNVDHQGTIWNLTEIQAGGCITFTQDAVSMPLLFGCKLLEATVEFPPLNKDERLVSSVIELTCDEQPDIHFTGQSKGEVVVALSHSAPKLEGYEVLIGELVSSDSSYEWKDLETTNIWQIPDFKDDFAKLRVPYSEAKVTTCGVFAVIYRLKSYIYSTRVSGNEEITHKIPEYPEVSVTIPAENVRDRSNLELILKVQEIPQQWFDCGEEFAGPVLHIKCPQITDLVEPATITLPLLLQGDKDELSKFSATDLRVFKCRSGDERADWDEITMQLPNAVELMNGVVRFQVKHFCRFTVWPSKKRRLRDRRLAHRINRFTRPFPLEAGFFACLCNTVDMSPGHAQLRLYCYPARLEPKVIENACSAHDIDRYGNGDSLLTLFHGDELRAKLWRGSEVKKTLKLRFRYDRKFEVDAIVRVLKEDTPHVKFLQHLREQSPRKLCELTIATQCPRKARDPHHVKQEVPSNEELERLWQQVPSDEELELLSHKLKRWKTVGRRLGIEEATLTAISNENEEYFEKTYQMLLKWKERKSSAATYQVIHEALCHELVERADLAEELYSRKLR